MTQPLFLSHALEFTKLAAETALPEDPNMWSDEALQELYKQVPYLADFDLNVVMETVDGERGYGLGHVEVSNKTEAPMTAPKEQLQAAGVRAARIPIIIKDSRLMPFDVIITDESKVLPLTESRLRQAMFRPQSFDVTSKTPGDQSMIGQLYPPFRQNYGFGGGGVAVSAGMSSKTASLEEYLLAAGKEKTAAEVSKATPVSELEAKAKKEKEGGCGIEMKTGSILEAVLPTANISDLQDFKEALLERSVKLAYQNAPATYAALELIGAAEPTPLAKHAEAMLRHVKPSVLQVTKLAEGYSIKTANHRMWAPIEERVDRGELVRRVGPKIALAADMTGSATLAPEGGVSEADAPPPPVAGPISAPGMYAVQTVDGAALTGVVIPNLLDVDGKALPISLFTDGQHAAVQADMAGAPVGEYSAPGLAPADQAGGHGVFYSEVNGAPVATLPLQLGARLQGPGTDDRPRFQAETFDGRSVQVSVQPYVQTVVNTDGVMLIPEGWMWLPLDNAEDVALAESPVEVNKTASLRRQVASVELRAGGYDCFSLRGHPVEKLASTGLDFLTQDQAMFILVGLGADPAYVQQKLASACAQNRPETVRVGHALKLASEVSGESYMEASRYLSSTPVLRHRMWKEAAAIPDPVAVDSVLSLGFINPENLATYIGYLPTLDEAQRRLCELLIGARLGMRELSEGALERAIRALEDVIEGLKVIAFQS